MNLWDGFINAITAVIKKRSFSISLPTTWTGWTNQEDKMPAEQHWVYFTNEEVKGLVPEFVAKLDMARKIAGIPFIITSGLRTPEKNQSIIGAVPESSHLKGLAVDLSVSNSHDVSRIIDAARKVGITRRGIYVNAENIPTHIHLDVDLEKPTDVLWVKKEGQAVSPTVTV